MIGCLGPSVRSPENLDISKTLWVILHVLVVDIVVLFVYLVSVYSMRAERLRYKSSVSILGISCRGSSPKVSLRVDRRIGGNA